MLSTDCCIHMTGKSFNIKSSDPMCKGMHVTQNHIHWQDSAKLAESCTKMPHYSARKEVPSDPCYHLATRCPNGANEEKHRGESFQDQCPIGKKSEVERAKDLAG